MNVPLQTSLWLHFHFVEESGQQTQWRELPLAPGTDLGHVRAQWQSSPGRCASSQRVHLTGRDEFTCTGKVQTHTSSSEGECFSFRDRHRNIHE